ncbi:hypothetical protein [Flexibacterium corallicola]|uniref:hypothetical protein n=1 Tax=Flexibacterium corallicola TaxID=3037259 RepID=UPI00286F93FB|nr:hypothetical protein [Pseudovibrio sp. M1P-2-3]
MDQSTLQMNGIKALSSSAPPTESGIHAQFLHLGTGAADSFFPLLESRGLRPALANVVQAELRDFSGFAENLKTWAAPGINYFKSERGAPTTKVAASQVLKFLAQSVFNRLSTTYLLTGRAARLEELRFLPRGDSPWVELYLDPRIAEEDFQLDPANGPSELFELAITIEELVEATYASLGRRQIPPSVFYSSIAIGLSTPFLTMRRHGVAPQSVAPLMRLFLTSFGKKINSGLVWKQRAVEGCTEIAPRRKACCLKYVLNNKPHLCSTCSRHNETLFFEQVAQIGGHDQSPQQSHLEITNF